MRSREDIYADSFDVSRAQALDGENAWNIFSIASNQLLVLETLLDIRDLLAAQGEKGK